VDLKCNALAGPDRDPAHQDFGGCLQRQCGQSQDEVQISEEKRKKRRRGERKKGKTVERKKINGIKYEGKKTRDTRKQRNRRKVP
jgi:hypothetical protein